MNSFLCRLLFFLQIESLAEALYTSSSVKDSLLSSKEWVTIRTDINLQQRLDAECLKAISTSTTYCGINVIWMYSFFHKNPRAILLFTLAPKLRNVSAAKQARISTVMVADMIVHGRNSSVKIVDLTALQLSTTDFSYSTTL